MSFRGEFVTISGFSEVILEVLLGCAWSIECLGFEIMCKLSINGEIITTSGLTEAYLETILEGLKGPIGVGMVKKVTKI